ncbi:type I DNA topoisomerase [Candidatus Nitrospira allomarina]|jgi:DNA topoisomerase I|uniref:DNA topoisomerase 1 n=1 Tax=Candidatus Nitrospira allomarina TaxID=3020900 RepID=A0AA96GC83_9BACT|nr:type I DNA topoisomerase [Candidatus Nitrospira allomarina]WNM59108.1 type I DNA topoisomerase [Candidatus Nitrospira allomarina]
MARSLVIVESPTKAKTLSKYLGRNYQVIASVGHLKDLPKSKLGIDLEHNFDPQYIVIRGKSKILKEIKASAKKAKEIFLAADPDREGEAIAWHIAEELNGNGQQIHRVLLNEITETAVKRALKTPSTIDMKKVNAQQARRVLDRLVGYLLSPLLWKKVRRGLSAGRVQSVAVRVICEREAEREAFQPEEYWSITATLVGQHPPPFQARLHEIDGERVTVRTAAETEQILQDLADASFAVSHIDQKEKRRSPSAPFITSRLQQDSARKLRFPAKKTMMLAQRLYEGIEIGKEGQVGLITYMRTDSTRIAPEAMDDVRGYIQDTFGPPYLSAQPNVYKTQKAAQEAHEAIRPTSTKRDPESLRELLEPDLYKLYKLIWNRFVASQMTQGLDLVTQVDVKAKRYTFRASGTVEKFDGYRRVYREEIEQPTEGISSSEESMSTASLTLPDLSDGESLTLQEGSEEGIISKQHFTQPPPRYNEALLIREMEEKGIGRPSTYATIISTIQDRHYVEKEEARLRPTELGRLVNDRLVSHFPDVFDVEFTARMENELDSIEEGEKDWVTAVKDFYTPFIKDLESAEVNMEDLKGKEEPTEVPCDKCGKQMVIKWGRNGHFLACPGYPECKNTKEFTKDEDGSVQVVETKVETTDEVCTKCGSGMVVKRGRFGNFLACSQYPECKTTKPLKLGVKCAVKDCGGDLVQKRTKKGKTFYSCSNYPTCTFAIWDRPINRPCPQCQAPFLIEKIRKQTGSRILCHNAECGYEEIAAPTEKNPEPA